MCSGGDGAVVVIRPFCGGKQVEGRRRTTFDYSEFRSNLPGVDKLRALETFIAIVDHRTLTGAAVALRSSLPSVVRILAALEADVGVRLLHRTTRRLSLTDDGRQYLERARRIVAEVDEADRSLQADSAATGAGLRGTLRVTAPILFGQMHVAPAVAAFLVRQPQIAIHLMLLDRVVNLVEEGFDVGVRIAHLADSSLVARAVGRIRTAVVASPDFLRRHGVPGHPRELVAAPCLPSSGIDGQTWTFRDGVTVAIAGRYGCNLAQPLLEACAGGAGFGRFPSYQVAPYLADRRLRVVLQRYEPAPRALSLVFPSARLLPARARLFIDAMRETLSSAAGVSAGAPPAG